MKPVSISELAEQAASTELYGKLRFTDTIYENAERHGEPGTANAAAQTMQLFIDQAADQAA
jgi:hypothetical protein